jgi:hypothetical protein
LLQEFILRITAPPFPCPPSAERHREYLTTAHGKEFAKLMKTVTGFVSVRKYRFRSEFSVNPRNATSYDGGGGGGDDDGDYDNDNDNNNNNNNNIFVINVIDVDKCLMV